MSIASFHCDCIKENFDLKFTIKVKKYDPIDDREMGNSGGFTAICEELGVSGGGPTLHDSLKMISLCIASHYALQDKINETHRSP